MNEIEKQMLENDLAIMEFLMYPNSPEEVIKQKSKTFMLLNPEESDLEERKRNAINKGTHLESKAK